MEGFCLANPGHKAVDDGANDLHFSAMLSLTVILTQLVINMSKNVAA